jgi:hypothetical protein
MENQNIINEEKGNDVNHTGFYLHKHDTDTTIFTYTEIFRVRLAELQLTLLYTHFKIL